MPTPQTSNTVPTSYQDSEVLVIDEILIDRGIQTRVTIDTDLVQEYSQQMSEGIEFPPVDVFVDEDRVHRLADGFHRIQAAVQAGKTSIIAIVHPGTRRDAILFAVAANQAHGLRLTNADKRRKLELVFDDPEWSAWSDREIARRSGVSHNMVSEMRKSICHPMTDSNKRLVERNGSLYEQDISHRTRQAYLNDHAPEAIKLRIETGELAIADAYAITKALETSSDVVREVIIRHQVKDAKLIPILERLDKQKSTTLDTIVVTGYLQGAGEPIHISEANVRDLEDVVTEARFYHRTEAIALKREQETIIVNYELAEVIRIKGRHRITLDIPDADLTRLKASDKATIYISVQNKLIDDLSHEAQDELTFF